MESSEAFYTTEPPAFTFRGKVRAWRDQNLLLAEELRGDQTSQRMSASGGVQTVWFSAPRSNGSQPQPIEVTSELLTYRRGDSTVIYSGKVRIEQERRTITCGELAVELDDSGQEAERMICRDDVRLLDPVAARRVHGDAAVYSVAQDLLEIYGDRVQLIDSRNNRLEGRYLRYDFDAGTVKIEGKAPALGPSRLANPAE